jgi:hypothetical protein
VKSAHDGAMMGYDPAADEDCHAEMVFVLSAIHA